MSKKKKFAIIISLICISTFFILYILNQGWERTWGGNNDENCLAMALDSSNNIYLVGSTTSFTVGSNDICLVKYDNLGGQQWYHTWGGSSIDIGHAIALDASNNIYLAGSTTSFGAGSYDMCLVKYDNTGEQQWYRTWGGIAVDDCRAIALDSFNNIYLAGYTASFGAGGYDMCLVKYDNSGVEQWYHTWGGSANDYCYAIALDALNNVYIAGSTASFGAGQEDMCIVKYDNLGVEQWYRTWGGSSFECYYAITLDTTNNIYLAGDTFSFGTGSWDMCIVKYDNSGTQQWYRTWGFISSDYCRGIVLDSLQNIYISGFIDHFGAGSYDMCLVKCTSLGIQESYRTWGGTAYDTCSAIAMDSSENIYLVGSTESFGSGSGDIYLVKYINPGISIIMFIIFITIIITGVIIAIILITKKVRGAGGREKRKKLEGEREEKWALERKLKERKEWERKQAEEKIKKEREDKLKRIEQENQNIVNQAYSKFQAELWDEAILLFNKSKELCSQQGWREGVNYAERMISECEKFKIRTQLEKERREKLKMALKVSNRIKMEIVRDALEMDSTSFNKQIIQWANEYGFKIDGDYLLIKDEDKDPFINDLVKELDRKFKEWGKVETEKIGKM